jgi:sarcosine oxidase, subunit gamma
MLDVGKLRSPLHGVSHNDPAEGSHSTCEVWAREVALRGYISLRGHLSDAAFAAAAPGALGTALPDQPCSIAQVGDVRICWLSPDEWMIIVPLADHAGLLARLNTALKGIRSQIVDNSGGFTGIEIGGAKAGAVLSHCTVYDLHRLRDAHFVGTTFGKSSVYMFREDGAFHLLLRRSFADYIWRFLVRAATPYGFGTGPVKQAANPKRPG